MGKSNKAILSPVPKGVSRELSVFLNAIKEHVQIQGGMGRGSDLDRAVTMRDWMAANGSKTLSISALLSASPLVTLYNDPSPSTPTGVAVFPAFNTVMLKWDRVTASWYSSTEIFRLTVKLDSTDPLNPYPYTEQTVNNTVQQLTPQFVVSAHVGTTFSNLYTDEIPPDTYAIYWVRHVNRDGVAGPVHSTFGILAHTHATPESVIREYSDAIYDGEDYKWLRSSVGIMDTLNRTIQGALGPDSVLSGLLSNNANLSDLLAEQSLSDSLDSHSSREDIKAQFSKNFARMTSGVHAAVNLSGAYVSRIQTLEASYNAGGTIDNAIKAQIDAYDLAAATPTGSIALGVNNYTVSYDGVDVSLQTLASASATAAGKYTAQWGVKSLIGDLQGGVGFYNNGATTQFIVDANTFAITNGVDNTSDVLPFIVTGGKVLIDIAIIQDATIYNLLAANVVAEKVAATVSLDSPVIVGGSISGTTLDINGRTTIDAFGNLVSKKAFLQELTVQDSLGNVVMDAAGLRGTFIKDLNVDSLQIQDQAVTVPHSVVINQASVTSSTPIVQDYPMGVYVGGGIQYAISISAILLSASLHDASLRVNITVRDGTTVVYSNFINAYSTTYLYVGTAPLCGMCDVAALTASLGNSLVFRIEVLATGSGSPSLRAALSGFISYAKR